MFASPFGVPKWSVSGLVLCSVVAVTLGLFAQSSSVARGAPAVPSAGAPAAGSSSSARGAARAPASSAAQSPSKAPKGQLGRQKAGARAKTGTEPRHAYVVAALGDSLTDERSHGGKYLAYIAERCPETRIDNFGRGGDMVNQMRRRFFSDVLPRRTPYTHLIVFGGVNDLYSDLTAGRTPEKVARDMGEIFRAAHGRGMRVVALTVAPWGGFRRYYNERRGQSTLELNRWLSAQVGTGLADEVVDAYSVLSCGDPERLCPKYSIDGIHFNGRGHEVLGKALYEAAFRDCR